MGAFIPTTTFIKEIPLVSELTEPLLGDHQAGLDRSKLEIPGSRRHNPRSTK